MQKKKRQSQNLKKKKINQKWQIAKKCVFNLFKINKSGNSTSLEIKQIQIKARRCLFSVVKLTTILKVKSIIPLKKKSIIPCWWAWAIWVSSITRRGTVNFYIYIYVHIYVHTYICIYIIYTWDLGFPGGWDSKESACNTGDLGFIPG